MILFRCKTCGRACMAEEAGANVTCQCGAANIVPDASEEGCVCVYKDGYPNEGMAMTLDELAKQVAEGQFGPLDLIYHNGTWQPLNMVFEIPRPPEKQVDTGDEIALKWKELAAIPGFAKPSANSHSSSTSRWDDLVHWYRRVSSLKYKTPGQMACYLLLVFVLAAVMYVLFIGALVNRILWRPAYVAVYNPSKYSYTATLMGRKKEVQPQKTATFDDIFVPFPQTRTLRLVQTEGNDAHNSAISVPVRPKLDVLVTTTSEKEPFGFYDMEVAKSLSLPAKLEQDLASQISHSQELKAFAEIQDELHDMGKRVFKGNLDDTGIITSEQYNLQNLGLVRSSEYAEHKNKNKTADDSRQKPYINGTVNITYANATALFQKNAKYSPATFNARFQRSFTPGQNEHQDLVRSKKISIQRVKAGVCKCTVLIENDGDAVLDLQPISGDVTAYIAEKINRDMDFTGTWHFTATICAHGHNAGKAKWQWVYSGQAKAHAKDKAPRRINFTLQRDYDGKCTFSN